MTGKLSFRRALDSDFDAVLNLAYQLADHINSERPRLTAKQFEKFYVQPHAPMQLLLAVESDRVVGMIAWATTKELYSGDTRAYISDLAVEASARGTGIGRALMHELISWANANDVDKLGWDVWRFNETAKTFYANVGGQLDEEALPYVLRLSKKE